VYERGQVLLYETETTSKGWMQQLQHLWDPWQHRKLSHGLQSGAPSVEAFCEIHVHRIVFFQELMKPLNAGVCRGCSSLNAIPTVGTRLTIVPWEGAPPPWDPTSIANFYHAVLTSER